jgi:hypothetical protein
VETRSLSHERESAGIGREGGGRLLNSSGRGGGFLVDDEEDEDEVVNERMGTASFIGGRLIPAQNKRGVW